MKMKQTAFLLCIAFLFSFNACNSSDEPPGRDVAAASIVSAKVCVPSSNHSSLLMTTAFQEQSNWCWAACGQMVMQFAGNKHIPQCEAASSLLKRNDCCNVPAPSDCNEVGFIEFAKHGFTADSINRALTWEELIKQIDCEKSPICAVRKDPFRNFSHMVVASGYTNVAGEQQVLIRNPAQDFISQPAYLIPYHASDMSPIEQYDSTIYYKHGNDYFNIRKKKS